MAESSCCGPAVILLAVAKRARLKTLTSALKALLSTKRRRKKNRSISIGTINRPALFKRFKNHYCKWVSTLSKRSCRRSQIDIV